VIERCDECCCAPIETVERRFEDKDRLHPWISNCASWTPYGIQIARNHQSFRPDTECSLYVAGLTRVHHDDQIGSPHIFGRQWLRAKVRKIDSASCANLLRENWHATVAANESGRGYRHVGKCTLQNGVKIGASADIAMTNHEDRSRTSYSR
jgi:hypothetical protein